MAYWLGILCWFLLGLNIVLALACANWRRRYNRLYYDWQQDHKRSILENANVQHVTKGGGREPMPGAN